MLGKIIKNKWFILGFLILAVVAAGFFWRGRSKPSLRSEKKEVVSQGIKKGAVEFLKSTAKPEEISQSETSTPSKEKKTSPGVKTQLKFKVAPPGMQLVPKLNAFIPADVKVQELTTQTIDQLKKPLYGMASGDVLEVGEKSSKLKLSSFVALETEKKGEKIERKFYYLPPETILYLSYPPGVPSGEGSNPFDLKVGERILARVSLSPGGKEAILLKIEGRKTK
jgi:hypothetical protein